MGYARTGVDSKQRALMLRDPHLHLLDQFLAVRVSELLQGQVAHSVREDFARAGSGRTVSHENRRVCS
jgi:hypothetical protein